VEGRPQTATEDPSCRSEETNVLKFPVLGSRKDREPKSSVEPDSQLIWGQVKLGRWGETSKAPPWVQRHGKGERAGETGSGGRRGSYEAARDVTAAGGGSVEDLSFVWMK